MRATPCVGLMLEHLTLAPAHTPTGRSLERPSLTAIAAARELAMRMQRPGGAASNASGSAVTTGCGAAAASPEGGADAATTATPAPVVQFDESAVGSEGAGFRWTPRDDFDVERYSIAPPRIRELLAAAQAALAAGAEAAGVGTAGAALRRLWACTCACALTCMLGV